MKALKIILMVVGSLVLIGGAGYLYASSGIKSKPGYADFNPHDVGNRSSLFSVNIGPSGVKPLRRLLEHAAEDAIGDEKVPTLVLRTALQELQGVQLRVYDSTNNRDVFDSAISETAAALKQKQWQTLMTVRDDEEHIMVMQYLDQDQIAGLSIMASTPDKALFLNLVGPFDVDAIASKAKKL